MKNHRGFELKHEYCTRYELQTRLSQWIGNEGWELLYIIPNLPPPPSPIQFTGSSTNEFVRVNTDGSFTITGSVCQAPISESGFEVVMIRFYDPLPEPIAPPEPCPRCSFPYPDDNRLDREA